MVDILIHSTPVKDANGYIRPLCSSIKLIFDEPSQPGQGYDEPDLVSQKICLKMGVPPMKIINCSWATDQKLKTKFFASRSHQSHYRRLPLIVASRKTGVRTTPVNQQKWPQKREKVAVVRQWWDTREMKQQIVNCKLIT